MSAKEYAIPGFLNHILLLWRLRMVMVQNGNNRGGRYSRLLMAMIVMLPSAFLGGFAFWFMSHPSISAEQVVSQFYLNLLCFVTAMLWVMWPVLSAGVEDGSERDRYLQYPISETRLLSVSIISGVLKPVGFFMFAPLIGASFGYMKGQGALEWGWTLLLLFAFIAMCATWSQAGVYWLRDVLRAKSNGKALTLTLVVFMALGMLLPQVDISWLYKQVGGVGVSDENKLEEFANIANAFSKVPPGYLGEGLFALSEKRIDGVSVELFGMLALALLGLFNAKVRLQRSGVKSASLQSFQQHNRLLFTSKGRVDKILAQREFFELWRNPRFRLLAIVPFFLIVVLRLVSADELLIHFFGDVSQLWLMAGAGLYAAALVLLTFTHNTFAYDGRGLLNLMNAPITPAQILKSKARIHRAISLVLGFTASVFYWIYVAPGVGLGWVLFSVLGVLILVPVVATVGLWESVHYPIKFDASLNRRERQPLFVSMAGFAGVMVGILPFVVMSKFLDVANYFSIGWMIMVACVLLAWIAHLWLLRFISSAFERRQGQVLSAITRV